MKRFANETRTENVHVIVRIGHGGTKNHRALATKVETDPGKPWNRTKFVGMRFVCTCPNTQNGHAWHRAAIVGEGWDNATCGG